MGLRPGGGTGPTAQLLRAPETDHTKALLAAVPHPGWKPHRIRR
ncbi:hypothetical protein [Streptomyces sp. NBC_00046]